MQSPKNVAKVVETGSSLNVLMLLDHTMCIYVA